MRTSAPARQPQTGISATRRRIRLLAACLLAALAALWVRTAWLQIAYRDRAAHALQRQHRLTTRLPARRGMILDRLGRVLAGTEPAHSVFIDPVLLTDPDAAVARLAAICHLDPRTLRHRLRNAAGRRFLWIARRVDPETARAVREAAIPGVGLIEEPRRRYPLGTLAAHILGFCGDDGTGLEGLEFRFDDWLAGRDGSAHAVPDAARRPLLPDGRPLLPPRDGGHLLLTIDAAIQQTLESRLADTLTRFRARSAVGIVIDIPSAEILAMACAPAFDPNHPLDVSPDIRRNRCITDPVEPGSTFKPFIAAAALAEKLARPGEVFDAHNGTTRIGRRILHDAHPHDRLSFEEALIRSSNIVMAAIGLRLGNARLYDYVTRFRFGTETGIELPGESPGIVLPLRRWTSYSPASIPMGQEIAVTPLQLIAAYTALLSDGIWRPPRIVRARLNPDGSLAAAAEPAPAYRVLPADAARYIARHVLPRVVTEGSGRRAALQNWTVLGKTGTAQIPLSHDLGSGYEPGAYLSSFFGAAPASEPRIGVLIMVERPDPAVGHYGSQVAAPAVRAVLEWTLQYLDIPPDRPASPPDHTGSLLTARHSSTARHPATAQRPATP